jgi:poly(A) polymerase
VRRYVTDAGDQLERLHRLTRADCTTRNRRKAMQLAAAYDDLEQRIARLREQEQLDAIRPDLDGAQIMEILGVGPGPVIGFVHGHLMEVRMERGPIGPEAAREELLAWWAGEDVQERARALVAEQARWQAVVDAKKARKARARQEREPDRAADPGPGREPAER